MSVSLGKLGMHEDDERNGDCGRHSCFSDIAIAALFSWPGPIMKGPRKRSSFADMGFDHLAVENIFARDRPVHCK